MAAEPAEPNGPRKKIKSSDLAAWARQLATLLQAGLPLARALELLASESESPALRGANQQLIESIRRGDSFSHALLQQGEMFPAMMASMVQAGELSGKLELVLDKYAGFLEQQEETKKRVQGMLVYPALLLSMGLLSIGFLLIVVIPKFVGIFQEFGQQLPWITRAMLTVSSTLQAEWWLVGGIIFLVVMGMRVWLSTPEGRRLWTAVTFAIPLLGPVLMKIEYSRFTLILGTLVGGGVPLLDALGAVRATVRHPQFGEDIEMVTQQITRGKSLAEAMKSGSQFPTLMVQMVVVGEETGKPEDLLGHLHTFYERGVDRGIRTLLSLVEPALVVAMGGLVGLMVMAVLLPILTISSAVR